MTSCYVVKTVAAAVLSLRRGGTTANSDDWWSSVGRGGECPTARQWQRQWQSAATAVTAATTGYQRGPLPAHPFGTDVSAWETPLKLSDDIAKSAPPMTQWNGIPSSCAGNV